MAKKAKSEPVGLDTMEIISRLLAMLVVKGVEKDNAVLQLTGAGFSNQAVAEMLGVTDSAVRGLRFRKSKKKSKKKSKSKAR